jgi:hypothetical protein
MRRKNLERKGGFGSLCSWLSRDSEEQPGRGKLGCNKSNRTTSDK